MKYIMAEREENSVRAAIVCPNTEKEEIQEVKHIVVSVGRGSIKISPTTKEIISKSVIKIYQSCTKSQNLID